MKNSFSSTLEKSLLGRDVQVEEKKSIQEVKKPNQEKPQKNVKERKPKNNNMSVVDKSVVSKPSGEEKTDEDNSSEVKTATIEEAPVVKIEKQSAAGRPKKDPKEKKVQVAVTLRPETIARLTEWAADKPDALPKYLSDYVDRHVEEIIDYNTKIINAIRNIK